jgi:hypothetical protein
VQNGARCQHFPPQKVPCHPFLLALFSIEALNDAADFEVLRRGAGGSHAPGPAATAAMGAGPSPPGWGPPMPSKTPPRPTAAAAAVPASAGNLEGWASVGSVRVRRRSPYSPWPPRWPQLLTGLGPHPPLHSRQRLPPPLLLPVRPRVGTDDPAVRANHAGPERRHRHVIGPRVRALITRWWHTQQHTSSDRMPFARMLPMTCRHHGPWIVILKRFQGARGE